MKKKLAVLVAIIALAIGSSQVMAADNSGKIAVVDVQKVVSQSQQVKSLKNEQIQKKKDLAVFVEGARKAVAAESDKTKKAQIEDKYNKELNDRVQTIDKDYAQKLSDIDKNISGIIEKQAKSMGYSMVLTKGIVLYGGEDITNQVIKQVK